MKGLRIFLATFALTITIGALAQQGGFPSRPKFNSVGVGVAAPAGTGNIAASGTVTASSVSASTSFHSISFQVLNGAFSGFFDAGGAGVNLGSTSAHPLSLYAGGAIGARMQPSAPFDALFGFTTNGTAANFPQGVTTAGTVTAATVTATAATVGGSAVCRADGTNCPPSTGMPAPIICNGTCAPGNVAVGQQIWQFKPTITQRNSTILPTADPELQFTAGNSGRYTMNFCFFVNETTTSAAGYRIQFNRTTGGSNFFMWHGSDTSANNSGFQASTAGGAGSTNSRIVGAANLVANSQNNVCGNGMLLASSGVTYAVEWAQNTSGANNTNMLGGSYILWTRIS